MLKGRDNVHRITNRSNRKYVGLLATANVRSDIFLTMPNIRYKIKKITENKLRTLITEIRIKVGFELF